MAALPERRGLEDTTVPNDRATVRVDAPDGVSEIILGGEAAADNVVLRKAHERDGAAFTLSRSDTQVLRVDPAGNVTVLTDPLQVSGAVKVGGSLEVGGELLLGGVRLSAAMLSGMILNAGPLPPPSQPPPSPPSSPCFTLDRVGTTERNNAWVSFWNRFTVSAVTAITATHSNTVTTYQTGSASDAQTIVTNMQGPTSFENVQSGNGYWSGAYGSSNSGCGGSLSFAVSSSSSSSSHHCSCNHPLLMIPAYYKWEFLLGSCSSSSGVSVEVCVLT